MNARTPKQSLITDDFEISDKVLGLGINGKVLQCFNKQNRQKFALKVCALFNFYLTLTMGKHLHSRESLCHAIDP